MQGLVTVFGGTGFVGRYVVRSLAKAGWRVRVAARRPHLAPEIKVMGDIGQVELIQANVRYPDSVARVLDGAQACVNLVGQPYQAGRQTFSALHVEGVRTVASHAKAAGVGRFLQVSGIGVEDATDSPYAASRAQGEAIVRDLFAGATVIRPSFVFGPEDDFFNRFAGLAAMSPVLPLIGGGANKMQPVYAGDVGAAAAAVLADPTTAGRTYELGGPGVYTLRQLMEILLREIHKRRILLPLPTPVAQAMGRVGDLQVKLLPFLPPQITYDLAGLMSRDNVVTPGTPGLAELGVMPTALEAVLPQYLWKYRKGGQFAQAEQGPIPA